MHNRSIIAAALGLALAGGAAAAPIVTTTPATNPTPNGLMSPFAGQAGVTTQTFNGLPAGAQPPGFSPAAGTVPGGGVVVNGSSTLYAPPLGDTSNFYAVAYNPSTNPVVPATDTFTPGGANNYLGLYWGSIDTFNTITFFSGVTQIATFSGAAFLPASGSQTAATSNQYVNFLFTGGETYSSVVFGTQNLNFEFDNLSYGNVVAVPEPASWAMMIAGFGMVGGAMRRRGRLAPSVA